MAPCILPFCLCRQAHRPRFLPHPCYWWIYPTYLLVRFMFPIPRYVTKPNLIRLFLLSIVSEEKFGQVGQEFKSYSPEI